jgi:hypothetical protein
MERPQDTLRYRNKYQVRRKEEVEREREREREQKQIVMSDDGKERTTENQQQQQQQQRMMMMMMKITGLSIDRSINQSINRRTEVKQLTVRATRCKVTLMLLMMVLDS